MIELVLAWDPEHGLYVEADDPRPFPSRHSHTLEEAASIQGEPGVVIVGGPLAEDSAHFEAALDHAELMVQLLGISPEHDAVFHALVRELSLWASSAPMDAELARDDALRRRWDLVFAATDQESR